VTLNDGAIHEGDGFNQSTIGFLLATKSNAPVIGTLGGGRNALFIYPKDNIIVVILNLVGGHPRILLKK
jgi:hypothetical protein